MDSNAAALFVPSKRSKPAVKMFKIIGAQLIDLILWLGMVLPFYLATLQLQPRWGYIFATNALFIGFFLFLFTFIPKICKGQTFGRWMFKIKLISSLNQPLPWRYFLFRETFIVLLPYVSVALYLTLINFFFPSFFSKALSVVFLLPLWFLFVFFFQKFNPDQQIFIDRYYQAWIVDRSDYVVPFFTPSSKRKSDKVK